MYRTARIPMPIIAGLMDLSATSLLLVLYFNFGFRSGSEVVSVRRPAKRDTAYKIRKCNLIVTFAHPHQKLTQAHSQHRPVASCRLRIVTSRKSKCHKTSISILDRIPKTQIHTMQVPLLLLHLSGHLKYLSFKSKIEQVSEEH